MRKKLVAVSLCFALLLVPIASNIVGEQEDLPKPFFENGFFHDPLIPEIICPPINSSVATFQTESFAMVTENIPLFTVNVLVAGDEEFLANSYETPFGVLGAFDYAEFQIQRASHWFIEEFSIGLHISGFVTWDSDDSLRGSVLKEEKLLLEVIEETEFHSVSPLVNILVAWTTQLEIYCGLAYPAEKACIVRPIAYWADENLVQHEPSHLLGALDGTYLRWETGESDCYAMECVMSYRLVYVDTIEEDGEVYDVQWDVPESLLTNNWCEHSQEEMSHIFACPYPGGC